VSPKIKGCAGNDYQMTDGPWPYGATWVELRGRTVESPTLAFVTVYLKRRMLDEIGLLDEGFTAYGFEDTDACLRARQAGWKTVIFREPVIMHGDGSSGNRRGQNWSLSYARNPDIGSQLNYDYFLRKHGAKREANS
jgi:GT2 family glycosyltransferase